MANRWWMAALLLALGLQGCGSKCDASNCSGCCDDANVCQVPTAEHCGVNGDACSACTGLLQCTVALGTCNYNGNGNTTGGHNATSGSSAGSTSDSSSSASSGTSTGSTSSSSSTTNSNSSSTSTGTTGRATSSSTSTGSTGTSTSSSTSSSTSTSSSSSSSSSATASSASSTGGRGTTGGTCPQNIPNLDNGVAQSSDSCSTTADCPTGFSCSSQGECVLNGETALAQVTLSFDDFEDLDLHVVDPAGCEIYWGKRGYQPDGGIPSTGVCQSGTLDLDSNSACDAATNNGIDIEDVLFTSNHAMRSGTYQVKVDAWKFCDSRASSNYAVQVRIGRQTSIYCGTISKNAADQGAAGSGTLVTTFAVP